MRWALVVAVAVVDVEVQASEQVASASTRTKVVRALKVELAAELAPIATFCSTNGGIIGAMTSCCPLWVYPIWEHSVT